MSASPEHVAAGQAVYTPRVLRAYDGLVLGLSNRWLWRCPTPRLLAHYDRHVTANHLEVGVGTGYFLAHCRFPAAAPRLTVLDLNPHALAFAAQRLARYRPETYRRNVLEPISMEAATFDSISLNSVLHCLPGSMDAKAVAFDHLQALMNPHAVLFGSTLLQGGVPRSWWAKRLMDVYNHQHIFSNRHDSLAGLTRALRQRFRDVSVDVVGCAAIFVGRL
jgi:hypothetical protein